MDHATVECAIKNAKIDAGIVELVRWMNFQRDVYTLYSCEGDTRIQSDRVSSCPYVLFHCWDPDILESIRDLAEPFGFHLKERRRTIRRRRVRCYCLEGIPGDASLSGLIAALPVSRPPKER